jgi:hypothetical protein
MPETRVRFPPALKAHWGHVVGAKFANAVVPAWPRLRTVKIKGGFHNELDVDFGPGLNAVIGGNFAGVSSGPPRRLKLTVVTQRQVISMPRRKVDPVLDLPFARQLVALPRATGYTAARNDVEVPLLGGGACIYAQKRICIVGAPRPRLH